MTPSKKLFIAATLVAAGYGVAALLGAPDPRLWPDSWAHGGPAPSHSTTAASRSADGSAGPGKVGAVRLLPESSAATVDRLGTTDMNAAATPKSTSPPALAAAASTETVVPPHALSTPLLTSRPLPRATLKQEAPRPLPTADRPATPLPVSQVGATAYGPPVPALQSNANSKVLSAGFATDTTSVASTNWNFNATPLQPIQAARTPGPVSPPPWPTAEEESVRSHVIVDGDSLAKLAGRYLDDPRRSEEIFALNRGLLSDPELLPIGAELKIPPRGDTGGIGSSMPQSRTIGAASIHSAEHTGLVPVRLLPGASGTMPRAQLLPPKPVE